MSSRGLLPGLLLLLASCAGPPEPLPAAGAEGWRRLEIESTLDGARERARLWFPEDPGAAVPLVLHLHTWSGDVDQELFVPELVEGCRARGWALLLPDFRGPNRRPEACASPLAVQDVFDALAYVEARLDVGPVLVHGVSGGGHMALVLAARAPRRWAGVSAWVPISDLARWHAETLAAGQPYWRDLEAVCGGPPPGPEYRARSPLGDLRPGARLDLNAGIRDGHEGSVPIGHTLRAFDAVAPPAARFGEEAIAALERGEVAEAPRVVPGRRHPVLVQRAAGSARVTIFDGGHEGDPAAALLWFEALLER